MAALRSRIVHGHQFRHHHNLRKTERHRYIGTALRVPSDRVPQQQALGSDSSAARTHRRGRRTDALSLTVTVGDADPSPNSHALANVRHQLGSAPRAAPPGRGRARADG